MTLGNNLQATEVHSEKKKKKENQASFPVTETT